MVSILSHLDFVAIKIPYDAGLALVPDWSKNISHYGLKERRIAQLKCFKRVTTGREQTYLLFPITNKQNLVIGFQSN